MLACDARSMAEVATGVGKVRESRMKKTELPVFVKLEAVCDTPPNPHPRSGNARRQLMCGTGTQRVVCARKDGKP